MSASPLVSVVMPTYEAGDYIQPCLESILSQSYGPLEVVIVDDGSTDDTLSIIKSFDDNRVNFIQREGEKGIPSARNKGIEAASGDYIACHDADDRSHPKRFSRQVSYLERNPTVAAVGSGARLIDSHGKKRARRRVLESPSLADLLKQNHFVHGSTMFRRSALQQVGYYDEWFELAEDYELFLRLANNYPVKNIDQPLYDLRIQEESVYASEIERLSLYSHAAKHKAMHDEEWVEIKRNIQQDDIQAVYDLLSTREKTTYHQTIARESLRYGELSKARSHIKKALEYDSRDIMTYLLFLLSFSSPGIVISVAKLYRTIVLNPRIYLMNLS